MVFLLGILHFILESATILFIIPNTSVLSCFILILHFKDHYLGCIFFIEYTAFAVFIRYSDFFFPNSVNRIREKTGVGRWLSYCSLIL